MLINDILETYAETGSVKATAQKVGCSWNRVTKILSSNGIVINETHALILKMHEAGKTAEEIAKQIGYSVKTVQAYIPTVRPYYNVNPSYNAVKIKRCRNKKEKKEA